MVGTGKVIKSQLHVCLSNWKRIGLNMRRPYCLGAYTLVDDRHTCDLLNELFANKMSRQG